MSFTQYVKTPYSVSIVGTTIKTLPSGTWTQDTTLIEPLDIDNFKFRHLEDISNAQFSPGLVIIILTNIEQDETMENTCSEDNSACILSVASGMPDSTYHLRLKRLEFIYTRLDVAAVFRNVTTENTSTSIQSSFTVRNALNINQNSYCITSTDLHTPTINVGDGAMLDINNGTTFDSTLLVNDGIVNVAAPAVYPQSVINLSNITYGLCKGIFNNEGIKHHVTDIEFFTGQVIHPDNPTILPKMIWCQTFKTTTAGSINTYKTIGTLPTGVVIQDTFMGNVSIPNGDTVSCNSYYMDESGGNIGAIITRINSTGNSIIEAHTIDTFNNANITVTIYYTKP